MLLKRFKIDLMFFILIRSIIFLFDFIFHIFHIFHKLYIIYWITVNCRYIFLWILFLFILFIFHKIHKLQILILYCEKSCEKLELIIILFHKINFWILVIWEKCEKCEWIFSLPQNTKYCKTIFYLFIIYIFVILLYIYMLYICMKIQWYFNDILQDLKRCDLFLIYR